MEAQTYGCSVSQQSDNSCPGADIPFTLQCNLHDEASSYTDVLWLVNGHAQEDKNPNIHPGQDPLEPFVYTVSTTIGQTSKISAIVYTSEGMYTTEDYPVTVRGKGNLPLTNNGVFITLCDQGSQNFQITNPDLNYTYTWTSDPIGFNATGTNVTFNNISQNTRFTVKMNDCQGTYNYWDVTVFKSPPTPILSPDKSKYHVRTLNNTYGNLQFNDPAGTSISNNSTGSFVVSDPGTYYMRFYYGGNPSCWTGASPGVVVPPDGFNFVPTTPILFQQYKPGYNIITLINPNADKSIMLKYANYYWVNGLNSTEILGSFSDGYKISKAGAFYLRGRDIETNTWGSTTQVQVQLLNDDGLNWIQTDTYDGVSSTPYAQTKVYFDETGKSVQTQTKLHTIDKGDLVFTSAILKDKYDRIVGNSLIAPIPQSDFKYNAAFLLDQDEDFYGPDDFDSEATTTHPKEASTNPGTIGWYYSVNNTAEPLTPHTKYPYSRTKYDDEGNGEAIMAATAGDSHFLGSGHEMLKRTFPVSGELDSYLAIRRDVTKINLADNLKDSQGDPVNTLSAQAIQTIVRDQNGRFSVSVSDRNGNVIMTALPGASDDYDLAVINSLTVKTSYSEITRSGISPWMYFYLIQPTLVTITQSLPHGASTYTVKDLASGKTSGSFAGSDGKWPAGIYAIRNDDLRFESIVYVSYQNFFKDVSYSFFNDVGRLVVSISPNGIKQLNAGVDYSKIDKTTYQYNHQGWLISLTEPDAGMTQYIYRKDGKIRFSQNAEQALHRYFSYTNYDALGRPVESGEYRGEELNSGFSFGNLASYSDAPELYSMDNSLKRDWIKTYYNVETTFNSIAGFSNIKNSTGQPYTQNFTRGAVASMQNCNIQTWYSYDEFGRVVWMLQKPVSLPRTFIVKYTYDFLGNVLTVAKLAYDLTGTLRDQFYHYYEYDANKRLRYARTSATPDETPTLRATYEYYLHGPLKRIVLGDNLQGLDFVYNINGWLSQINHPDKKQDPGKDGQGNGVQEDVFGMVLDYYESDLHNVYAQSSDADQRRRHMPFNSTEGVVVNHVPLPRFASPFEVGVIEENDKFRQYSAQNPKYKELIIESKKKMANESIDKTNQPAKK